MPHRILVLSASVGAGHGKAGDAVEAAIRELEPTAEVRHIDVLDLTNAAFRRLYGTAYLDLVNKAPHMLGVFYDMLDKPVSSLKKSDRLRRLVERVNLQRLLKLLKSESWDIIINTHFLPAELIAFLRRHEKISTPHFTVTTDFESHRLWANQPCDHYFAATPESAEYLGHWGIPMHDISVSGIPIHPDFSKPKDRNAILASFGLEAGDEPIVLQMSGGFGVGPIEQLHNAILSIERPLRILTVTGKNEDLKAKLESAEKPARHRVKILGFRKDMADLMAVADVIVSKPGGLTTSEAIASGTAMVIVNPIPGQESRNSDYILEKGAGIKINAVATLPYKLGSLLADSQRLALLKSNALKISKPRAAFEVAQKALQWQLPK